MRSAKIPSKSSNPRSPSANRSRTSVVAPAPRSKEYRAAAFDRGDPDTDVLRPVLRVFDEYVEVAIALEDPSVEQLHLRLAPLPPLNQLIVGVGGLRILVQALHVRVRWRRIEIEVVFLD